MPRRRRRSRSFLWVSVASVLLVVVGVAHAEPVATEQHSVATTADPIAAFVAEASQRFGIPASWIRAVMQVESFGDVRAMSPKGAMGLMQIMPETWAALRSRYGLGADPYDAHDNIMAGAAYLRELLRSLRRLPASSRPTMPVQRATKIISRPVGRCLRRHAPTWPRLAPMIGGGAIDDAHGCQCSRAFVDRSAAVRRACGEQPDDSHRRHPIRNRASDRPTVQRRIGRVSRRNREGLFVGMSHRRSAAMSPVALDRRLGGLWRTLECWRGGSQEPDQRTAR